MAGLQLQRPPPQQQQIILSKAFTIHSRNLHHLPYCSPCQLEIFYDEIRASCLFANLPNLYWQTEISLNHIYFHFDIFKIFLAIAQNPSKKILSLHFQEM